MGAVVRGPVPEAIRAIDPLPDPDYTDAFEAATGDRPSVSAEQWARAIFEGAPAAMRGFLLVSWRAVLGLRLGPLHSADHILGWHVVDRSANSVTIELRSWFLSCYLLFWAGEGRVVFSSSIRYRRRIGALVWPPASILHRRIVAHLLRRATSRAIP